MIMSNIWVTTDWHAIEIDERTGRKSISNSFLKLTRKAEKLVQQNDIILCLGDIAFRGQDDIVNGKADEELSPFGDMIRNMPGYKILVKGNHDGLDNQEYLKVGFQEVGTAATLGDFLFTHKPYPVSNDQVNVHGHTHHEHYIGLDDGKHIAIPPTEKSNDPPLLLLDDVLEQAKQKHMKEPMRTVQHLKDADREFCHKLATDSNYLKEVISLEDSYEAVMTNGLNESYIINTKNTEMNIDSWKRSPGKNVLYVTGLSGSGKTTIGEKMERSQDHTYIFELDGIEYNYDSSNMNILDKIKEEYPEYNHAVSVQFTHEKYTRRERAKIIQTAIDIAIKIMEKDYQNLYIVEGTQIYQFIDPSKLKNKPIIILGTSMMTSAYRRAKRSFEKGRPPEYFIKLFQYYLKEMNPLHSFKNGLQESISPARIPGLGHHYIHPNAVQASMMLATMMDDGMDPTREAHVLEAIDPIDIDIETIDESVSEDNNLYPVYIMLMHSGTTLANAIKNVTHAEFSHSSISFDPSMKKMYSFGRPKGGKAEDGLVGSFKSENIHDKWFTERSIPFAVYVVPCTKNQIRRMKKRLDYFIQNATKFTYDFTGLIKNYFHVADNPEHRWFCSRFVADILNAGSPKGSPFFTEPSLVRPEDFKHTKFATFVTNGLLSKYNESFVKTTTDKIFAAFNQNKKPIAESVTPYDIMMSQVINESLDTIITVGDNLYYISPRSDGLDLMGQNWFPSITNALDYLIDRSKNKHPMNPIHFPGDFYLYKTTRNHDAQQAPDYMGTVYYSREVKADLIATIHMDETGKDSIVPIDEVTLSPMGLRKEDPKKKKKKLSKPDDPPKHTPGDDWDLVDKDHMVLPPDIQILEPHISENASMISHLPNQILDESVTLYHGSPSKFKKVRELRVESEEITNPNDTLSNKAVKLSFYDKNVKIGEASISAIDTNNGFLYDFEVFKQYRGRGYGRRIMQYIMSHYSVTDLTVDSSNMVAINLYKSFGFKRKQSYYDKVNKEKLEWYQRLPNTINETIPDIQILEPHVSENASVSIVSLHGGLADDFHEVRSDYEPPERKALRLHKKALEYKLANLDEGAVDYLLREIRAYKIRFDRHGNVRITKRETNHLKEHFNNSVNLLRAYRNADDIASVKQECMKLRYMSEILLKYYIRPNNHSDELKELINLRSTILNALNTNLKWVKQKDPKYNFAEEYDRSKYGSDINLPRNVVRDATKTIVTLLA